MKRFLCNFERSDPKTKIKMKKILSILGAVCICLGFAMATGVDQNPIQAVYALACMGAALVCIKSAERIAARSDNKTHQTTQRVYDYQAGTFRDVA